MATSIDLEILQLKDRIRRLADEKSYLQLVIDLIQKLDTALGTDNMMQHILKIIMESVGGTNIKLYCWIDEQVHYIDFKDEPQILTEIDDNDVLTVIKNPQFKQKIVNSKNNLLQYKSYGKSWHWIFPLLIGRELIGVIKIENLVLDSFQLKDYLSIVFNHIALLLNNEIRNYKRRQIEEKLRNSEAKLLTILDNVDAYIYLKDTKGLYLFANKPVRELWQVKIEDIIGFGDENFFDVQTARIIKENDLNVLEYGEVLKTEELNTIPKTGKTFCYQSTKLPLRREDGSIYALCGISVDITERKQIENILRTEKDRIQTYLDTIETLIVALDVKGNISLINRKGCQILGYEKEELLGKFWFEMCLPEPENMEIVYPIFLKIISGDMERVEYFENKIINRTGECRDIAWHNALLHDEKGNIIGLLSSGDDITERKKNEEELRQYREHLEKLVEDRTLALFLAKESAETANVAKSTFIATMSHELRTPLNAILGFSELMRHDTELNETQKNTLDIINRSGEHLLNMINDVLEISKIEAGKLELSVQTCDFIQLLQDIADMFRLRALSNQLHFNLQIAADIPRYIAIDCGKLRQVLINLLGNAIKFTERGSITLYVENKSLSNGTVLVIKVIDTGIGISPEQQQQLFKPFVQLSRKNVEVEGTGLGLTISKALIELLGGTINVESASGLGSTFKIELPVTITEKPETDVKEISLPIKSITSHTLWKLLIVDDNADNRLLMASLLIKAGFQIRQAENGKQAVKLFKEWQPHLIWMDIIMPVMDGYKATRIIRQLPDGDKVKIIALTASLFKENHQRIINAGCDAVIHKPFQNAEIFTALTKNLGIEFIYEDVNAISNEMYIEYQQDLINTLPLELKQRLHEAALVLDIEEVDYIIAEINNTLPELAYCLNKLAKLYQFEQLANLSRP